MKSEKGWEFVVALFDDNLQKHYLIDILKPNTAPPLELVMEVLQAYEFMQTYESTVMSNDASASERLVP